MDILDITTTDELAEFGRKMSDALLRFKNAAVSAWEVLESYGVTYEKMQEINAAIGAGTMTRRGDGLIWACRRGNIQNERSGDNGNEHQEKGEDRLGR